MEVIWLLRGLKPDFKTIADFRRNNRAAFRPVFRSFVLLCRQLDLFGREFLAVDGTRIKAVNNKDRNFTRAALTAFVQQADEKLAGYLKDLDTGDTDEDRVGASNDSSHKDLRLAEKTAAVRGKRERHKALLEELERAGEDQISLTDPDSRAMAQMTRVGVGDNVQVAVDVKHKLHRRAGGPQPGGRHGAAGDHSQDRHGGARGGDDRGRGRQGYFKIEDIEACKASGITPYIPKPVRGPVAREGFFPKEAFRFDPTTDTFTCLGGQTLRPCRRGQSRDNIKIDYSNRKACLVCPLRSRCTKTYRHVSRLENEAVLDRMAARLAARPEVLDQRRTCVEHPFGSIKQWMHQGAFLRRRLDNVRGEFSLTALACNIRRAISLVGVPGLIEAAKA